MIVLNFYYILNVSIFVTVYYRNSRYRSIRNIPSGPLTESGHFLDRFQGEKGFREEKELAS